jgi:hypothetical protein
MDIFVKNVKKEQRPVKVKESCARESVWVDLLVSRLYLVRAWAEGM